MWGIGSAAPEGRKFFEVELTTLPADKKPDKPVGDWLSW